MESMWKTNNGALHVNIYFSCIKKVLRIAPRRKKTDQWITSISKETKRQRYWLWVNIDT